MEHQHPPHFERVRLRIRGQVQGVGFRPFIYKLAKDSNLTGWVKNDAEGVLIEAQGHYAQEFKMRIADNPPPLSLIQNIEEAIIVPIMKDTLFEIIHSEGGQIATSIPPDAAVCPDCLTEMRDPNNPRYGYPFINCTHCGPRYSITRSLPYDRAQTSMAHFDMCSNCHTEFVDPLERRFHAQPTCCPECGPTLSHSLAEIGQFIRDGKIIALKGIGGFHLVCDALNPHVIEELRRRKQRQSKPFAVMVADLHNISLYAELNTHQKKMLTSTQAPIVLLDKRPDCRFPESVAPGLNQIGMMLPYTPIHHLLMDELEGHPVIMTSANPGGEPLVIDNQEARERLQDICDVIVDHDRDILIRVDDSLVRIDRGETTFLRRARGYTPTPIHLNHHPGQVIALGSFLKNTLCLTREKDAFVSQHIGDLDSVASLQFLQETLTHMTHMLEIEPELVVHDAHPDLAINRLIEQLNLPALPVQHHHAHIASVMAENHLIEPVMGVALDGFGLSLEGEMWGGEMLKVDRYGFNRLGHLKPLALPGGDKAARQPWRMAVSALYEMGHLNLIRHKFGHQKDLDILITMLDKGLNSPKTSSMGRLFDAACGLLGLLDISQYEGHGPLLLESLVDIPKIADGGWQIENGILDFTGLLERLCNLSPEIGANLFHGTVIEGLAEWIDQTCQKEYLNHVCLSGGCFQNKVLMAGLKRKLNQLGYLVFTNQNVPANDGGLSLGQAWIGLNHLAQQKGE